MILLYDYTALVAFCLIAFMLTYLIVFLSDLSFEPEPDMEKISPYECGFQPFDFELQQFDVKYYIVALFFLIFDVEIAFIIPFINVCHFINIYIFFNFFFFLLLLILALIYEWKKNYLDWE